MTRKQYKILKYIRTHNNTQAVCKKFNVDYQELQNKLPENSLIFNRECTKVYLTDQSESNVEALRRDSFRYAMPVIISIIALIRPEIELLIKYLVELLKK